MLGMQQGKPSDDDNDELLYSYSCPRCIEPIRFSHVVRMTSPGRALSN